MHDGFHAESRGAEFAERAHVGREFQSLDLIAVAQERKHQTSGARADFQGRTRVGFQEIRHQAQLGFIVLRIPEGIVEFGFE